MVCDIEEKQAGKEDKPQSRPLWNTTKCTLANRAPKCDVTKILFLEYFNFGSGF